MTLATVDADGNPSARIVLLRGLGREGARFFTNRNSRKGKALAANARAALLFHWDLLDRQVRIEGRVSLATDAESDEYFMHRPVDSRVNAWASDQSEPVGSRDELERRAQAMTERFAGTDVPRPPHWGGYRVSLDRIEFWQGDKYRLHDRIVYLRADSGGYGVQRLCP
jgi:pyridoxamine 5'-phosphate oxidase